MASATIQQRATQVIGEERQDLREKVGNVFRRLTEVLEVYSARRLNYLEEQYGKEWWSKIPHV